MRVADTGVRRQPGTARDGPGVGIVDGRPGLGGLADGPRRRKARQTFSVRDAMGRPDMDCAIVVIGRQITKTGPLAVQAVRRAARNDGITL